MPSYATTRGGDEGEGMDDVVSGWIVLELVPSNAALISCFWRFVFWDLSYLPPFRRLR